jgi:hypothetical protein
MFVINYINKFVPWLKILLVPVIIHSCICHPDVSSDVQEQFLNVVSRKPSMFTVHYLYFICSMNFIILSTHYHSSVGIALGYGLYI